MSMLTITWFRQLRQARGVTRACLVGVAVLVASCAHLPATPSSSGNLTARDYGSMVADWQLDAFDDLSYLPTFVADSAYARGWVKGAFYIGLDRFAEATDDAQMLSVLERLSRDNGFDLGRQAWHADDQAVAAVYAKVAGRLARPEMIRPARAQFDAILADRPNHGLEFVQGSDSEGGCQRRWCWADAIFMGPPAWAEMTRLTGDERYRAYAVEETKATIEYLFDDETALFFRDSRYFDKRTKNGQKVFWSRGNGWVFAGLARFIEALPEDHSEREYFIDIYQKMAAALIVVQRDDGYWPTSLHDADLFTNPETSGTGFFGFGLAWGLNTGILAGAEYELALDRAWLAMTAAIDANGKLGWVQQVGKAPEATTRDSSQIYGAGAFLLMAAEMVERE